MIKKNHKYKKLEALTRKLYRDAASLLEISYKKQKNWRISFPSRREEQKDQIGSTYELIGANEERCKSRG
jgi:hypothetical protein